MAEYQKTTNHLEKNTTILNDEIKRSDFIERLARLTQLGRHDESGRRRVLLHDRPDDPRVRRQHELLVLELPRAALRQDREEDRAHGPHRQVPRRQGRQGHPGPVPQGLGGPAQHRAPDHEVARAHLQGFRVRPEQRELREVLHRHRSQQDPPHPAPPPQENGQRVRGEEHVPPQQIRKEENRALLDPPHRSLP